MASQHGLSFNDLDQRLAASRSEEQRVSHNEEGHDPFEADTRRDWDAVFALVDLAEPDDISMAWGRYKALGPPWPFGDFLTEAHSRIPTGSEASFMRALGHVTEFGLAHLECALALMPEACMGLD